MSFPENLFPPSREIQARYFDQVSYGRACARDKSVVICGLARSIEPIVRKTIARIEEVGELFKNYKVVIYENDSNDKTPEILKEWASLNKDVVVTSETLNERHWPQCRNGERTAQLAKYRNWLLEIAKQQGEFDYMIMLDTDLEGGWSVDGICHSLVATTDWSMIGSYGLYWDKKRNNRQVQFDLWAYRLIGRWKALKPIGGAGVKFAKHFRGESMVPVWSCFGGLGIYKWDEVKDFRYEGGDCEHAIFHRQLIESGGRVFMNPSQIVLYNYPPGYTP